MTPSTRHISSSRGVALVLVLWMLALLSVIAGSLVYSSRTELQIAANLAAQAQAEAIADAGVHKAIYELAGRPANDPERWQGNGLPHDWTFADTRLRITIVDESGRIDLNTAPDSLLRGLFLSIGLPQEQADALADAIIDWRDPDDLRRLHGVEKEDYLAAGRASGPANAKFEAVEELRQVLGMTEDIYRRIEPLVTVHSGQAGVNTTVAGRGVLLALPGALPEIVDPYLEQRRATLAQNLPPPPLQIGQGLSASATGTTFTILVEVFLSDNTRFFREAVVRLSGNPKEPFAILAWRAPLQSSIDTVATAIDKP